MAYVLTLLSIIGQLTAFVFLTLSIASGLYYLSELVEEHSVLSAKVLRRLIYAVITTQVLLWLVDGFPFYLTLLGVASHAVYMTNLRHFPIVKLTDVWFLLSCGLVVLNHWLWFRYFSEAPSQTYSRGVAGNLARDRYSTNYIQQPTFTEIASYFGLCVWLVPFALFVSLSAGENVLPSMGSEYATGERAGVGAEGSFKKGHKRRNTGMAKAAVNSTREWISENGAVLGMWKHENVKPF